MSTIPNLMSFFASDPELFEAVEAERIRQEEHLELIASENYTSPGVMALQGSILTNKYAEGYPGKRYYGGCQYVDNAEDLAIARAQQLFGAAYVNVQPHSGSQANFAVYQALLNPGDTVLGMDLNHGGHLTHGSPVNFSGKLYTIVPYGVNAQGHMDYEAMEDLARKHRPQMIIAGFSAYPGVLDWQRFRAIADEVGAYLMVDMAHVAGLVAAGLYPNPLPYADVVTTTTHKTLRGPRGGMILSRDEALGKKFNSAIFPGSQGGPLMHVIAAKAFAFGEALQPAFKTYQTRVLENAKMLAHTLQEKGIDLVSGGTENHLMLLDLTALNMSGKQAEALLGEAFITVNKNTIPFDTRSPFQTSGVRIGTPALTSRGMGTEEMKMIASWIAQILRAPEDAALRQATQEEVRRLCAKFPVYHVS